VSQHRMLIMEMAIKFTPSRSSEHPLPKIKWYELEKEERAREFRKIVVEKMLGIGDMEGISVNDCWNDLAEYIRSAAKDILGETKRKGVIDRDTWWWTEEVQSVIWEKRENLKSGRMRETYF
jgi:hypothetical protein